MVRLDSSTAQGPGVRKPASLFIQTQKAGQGLGLGFCRPSKDGPVTFFLISVSLEDLP